MSQLYLYSNIWIYIWSVFSRVGTYFTYLIHNEASPVCGNYLPCETQRWGQGSVKRRIIQTVRFAYQNMAGRLYTAFHLDYQWNCSWLAPSSCGQTLPRRSPFPGLSLVEPGAAAGGERIGGSVCCLGCQWVEILKTERSKSDYILHVFNWGELTATT